MSFTDSLGNAVTLEGRPQRVAALIGSYAETWVLAGEDTLAAVTQDAYDERGLELGEDVTNVGSNQTPELEALFAAQPDLVLLTPDLDGQLALAEPGGGGHPRRLVQGGVLLRLPRHAGDLHPPDRAGRPVPEQRAGRPGGDRPGAGPRPGGGPTVLLLRAYSTGVRAKNSDNIAGVMLKDLGCVNIADSDSGLLEELQMESILAADPDHIFVTTMGSSTEKALASLTELFHSDPAWESSRR